MMIAWTTPASQNRSYQSVIQSPAPKSARHAIQPRNAQNSGRGQRWARVSRRASHAIPLILAALALLWPSVSSAQGTLAPVGQQVFLDASGNPINNGKICTYAAGTSTPLATYSDQSLMTANANPIRTNSAGRPTTGGVYLSATTYKFLVLTAGSDSTCSTGTTIWTQDNIAAVPSTALALDVTGTAGEALAAGDVAYLSDGSASCGSTAGRWYKADADATCSSTTATVIGMIPTAIASGDSGSIRLGGRITGLSGLSAGELYYVSATAGSTTATPPTNAWFIGKADSTTSLIIQQNQGGVRLPDSDGTHSLVARTSENLSADRILTFAPSDGNRTITLSGSPTLDDWFDQSVKTTAAPSFNAFRPPQGRCTLTSATPVTTADVTAATTLYYALYGGNQITLYNGSTRWVQTTFTELSIAVPATTNTMYDVFVDYTAGTPALEVVAWSSDTARATALATQNGVYVQTSDTDSLYVCSFRTTGSSGQTEDSFAKRYVWNYYNRVNRTMRVYELDDTWTYTTATWRQANADTANQLDFVIGVSEDQVEATLVAGAQNNTAGVDMRSGIGLDATNAIATTAGVVNPRVDAPVAAYQVEFVSTYRGFPGIGRHVLTWLEYSEAAGTTTWAGDFGDATLQQYGMVGTIRN